MSAQSKPINTEPGSYRPRVMLLSAAERADMTAALQQLRPLIERHADVAVADLEADLSGSEFEVAVVFGGDGSILRAAHQMGRRQRPVLGVNLGKLGFLADLAPADLYDQLQAICLGRFKVVEHLMYECQVLRSGQSIFEQLGLNEVAVLAGPPFAILDIDLYVDSQWVTTYSCDGLIVSTPIGSTAHSLSAGGPILRQDLQAFVISPISPHTLTNRPVVDSSDRVFEMVVARPHAGTTVVADGRMLGKIEPGDRIRVARSEARFKMIELPGHNYYRTLREKLGWGGRLRLNEGS